MRIVVIKKRSLIFAGLALLLLAAVIVLILSLPGDATPTMAGAQVEEYQLNVLPGKNRELPVYSVERPDNRIALTINAAWKDDKTAAILETLEKHDVKATFFVSGQWVDAYPDQLKAIAEAGHEIGNLSLTHPHMNKLTTQQVQEEITKLDDKVEALTGKRSTKFRAPFGEYNDTVINAARELGYEAIQWQVDTIDWKKERSAEAIVDAVMGSLEPGSIILCHNNGHMIEDYLPTLIEKAQAEGYEFVTIDELLLEGNTTIDAKGRQKLI